MADIAKCARPSCDCQVPLKGPYGKYCSENCKEAGQITELRCDCPHPECRQPEQAMQGSASIRPLA